MNKTFLLYPDNQLRMIPILMAGLSFIDRKNTIFRRYFLHQYGYKKYLFQGSYS